MRKNNFIILILIFIISSCSKNEYEQKLIGNWNNYPIGGLNDVKFYKDSVILYEYYTKRKGTWKADKSKIKIYFQKYKDANKPYSFVNYKLKNDTLVAYGINKKKFDKPLLLLKVTDYWKHYLKEFDLKIELPNPNFELIQNDKTCCGVDIFIGFRNGKIRMNNFKKPNDLLNYILYEKEMHTENEAKELYFNLIIDKKITENKVDSIKRVLKIFSTMKIFRIYKNDTVNYGKYDLTAKRRKMWKWYGRYE